jgi:hypothetical protein
MNLGIYWVIHTIAPQWMHDQTPDEAHFYRRKFTAQYQQRKRIVTKLWLGVAMLSLLIPFAPLVVSLFLMAAFLSFSLLDETPDKREDP